MKTLELYRSWSLSSIRKCVKNYDDDWVLSDSDDEGEKTPTCLEEERKMTFPADCVDPTALLSIQDIFLTNVATLWKEEIACDVTIRVLAEAADDTTTTPMVAVSTVRAHWAILLARLPKLFWEAKETTEELLRQWKETKDNGNDLILTITGGVLAQDPHYLHLAVASAYGVVGWARHVAANRRSRTNSEDSSCGSSSTSSSSSSDSTAHLDDSIQLPTEKASSKKYRTKAFEDLFGADWLANLQAESVTKDLTHFLQASNPQAYSIVTQADSKAQLKSDDDQADARASLSPLGKPDVAIVGCRRGSPSAPVEWTVPAHASLLCAHSQYFRNFLQRWVSPASSTSTAVAATATDSTTVEVDTTHEEKFKRIFRLDSDLFSADSVKALVCSCYGNSLELDSKQKSWESIVAQEMDCAIYFGLEIATRECEQSIAAQLQPHNLQLIMDVAEQYNATFLRWECHKFLCRNVGVLAAQPSEISLQALQKMLTSNFVELPEDELLHLVLNWSDATQATNEETKSLVTLIRLPFVPVPSVVMATAVQRRLVSGDMLKVLRLFQTDSTYRRTMLHSETMYTPRQGQTSVTEWSNRIDEANRLAEERERREDRRFMVVRMLGVVNGRNNFERIDSVRLCSDHLECSLPTQSTKRKTNMAYGSFSFHGLDTEFMPTSDNRARPALTRCTLSKFDVNQVQVLLAAMLRRENALRLHPRIQAIYRDCGENEEKGTSFTTALQGHVASEFNVEPSLGIELIRSASTLFPETAMISHYVRHNRCTKGLLKIGDVAPDVNLFTLTHGRRTSLWSEIEKRCREQCPESSKKDVPVLVLGASYT